MFLRNTFELLIKYFDAKKNYYDEPVLRQELEIQYKEQYDGMIAAVSKASKEEREDAIEYLDGVIKDCHEKEQTFLNSIDDYREREDLHMLFEKQVLEIRLKISEIEGYKRVINEYNDKKEGGKRV